MPILSLVDVIEHCAGCRKSLREGEEYFESGLLLCVGIKRNEENIVSFKGLAEDIAFEYPVEVVGEIDSSEEIGKRVKSLVCGCPDGNEGRCKHSVAVLMRLTRDSGQPFEDLSAPGLEAEWEDLKTTQMKEFHKPISEWNCKCFKKEVTPVPPMQELTEEEVYHIKDTICEECPDSTFAQVWREARKNIPRPAPKEAGASK